MRNDAFKSVIEADVASTNGRAALLLLRPAWFLAWRTKGFEEALWTLIRLPILAAAAGILWLAGVTPTVDLSNAIALIPPALLFLLAVRAKARRMRTVRVVLPAAR
jgi:hypothetical protein